MGALRTIGLIFVTILFFVGMMATGTLLVIVNSLDYDNVEADLNKVVKEVILEEVAQFDEEDFNKMQEDCALKETYTLEADETEFDLTVPCDIVEQGKDAVMDYYAESLTSQIYKQNYTCEFWDCVGEENNLFFLFSEESYDYWNSKFYLALGLTIFFFILIFLIAENKSNSFILAGIIMIISGLPLLLGKVIIGSFMGEFLQFLTFIFSSAYWVAIKIFAFAVVVIVVGILWKVFHVGLWVSKKFGRSGEKVVEEKK